MLMERLLLLMERYIVDKKEMKRALFFIATLFVAAMAYAGGQSQVCDFDQVKHLKIVKTPVESSGKLYYEGENMAMLYSKPEGEYFKVTETTISMLAGKKKINSKLSGNAQFKQLRDLLIFSMKGDLDAIKNMTNATVEKKSVSGADEYTFTSKEQVKKGYYKIVLRYNKSKALEYMELHQPGGDYTTYTLKNIKLGAAIPAGTF